MEESKEEQMNPNPASGSKTAPDELSSLSFSEMQQVLEAAKARSKLPLEMSMDEIYDHLVHENKELPTPLKDHMNEALEAQLDALRRASNVTVRQKSSGGGISGLVVAPQVQPFVSPLKSTPAQKIQFQDDEDDGQVPVDSNLVGRRESAISGTSGVSQASVSIQLVDQVFQIPIKSAPCISPTKITGVIVSRKTRMSMSSEKKSQLLDQIMHKRLLGNDKFKMYPPNLTDEKILENVCLLDQQLKTLFAHLKAYDMVDVFQIVDPVSHQVSDILNSSALQAGVPKNHFKNHHEVTPDLAAASSTWWAAWGGDDQDTSYQEDLWITNELIKHNTDPVLYNKCQEEIEHFHTLSHGGPLLLSLILNKVFASAETAMKKLVDLITKIKISDYPGEDVPKVVSIIRAAHTHLVSASKATGRTYLPSDFNLIVVRRLQTTSVPAFNRAFRVMEEDALNKLDMPLYSNGQKVWQSTRVPELPEIDVIFSGAEAKYLRYQDIWTGKKPAAHMGSSDTVPAVKACWNCGSKDHMVYDCPEPRNEAAIQANQKRFMKNRAPW